MNDLDSRFLRLGDCYAQRLTKPGTYKYVLTPAGSGSPPLSGDTYAISVRPDKGTGAQHYVVVRQRGKTLLAEPAELVIQSGDIVLWHTLEAATPGFAVLGLGEMGELNSSSMKVEALYSHAFGSPGRYGWGDANGGRARGEVEVRAFDLRQQKDHKKWVASLAKGTVIKVTGDKAAPARVQVVVGQTVLWLVDKVAGITITDARLLRPNPANKKDD